MTRHGYEQRRLEMLEKAGDREIVTTTEAARRIGVCPRTVTKWFDEGRIEGFMYPGSKHRRLFADSVETWRHRMETIRSRRRDA